MNPAGETTRLVPSSSQVECEDDEAPRLHFQNQRPNKRYRGGFSSSICSLFVNPARSRSDCCSLTLCGLLAADRNRYLMLHKRPKSWIRRCLTWAALPTILYLADKYVLAVLQALKVEAVCQAAFPDDGSGPYLDVFNATKNDPTNKEEDPLLEDLQFMHVVLYFSFFLLLGCLLSRAAFLRLKFRNGVMKKLYELDFDENSLDERQVQSNLAIYRRDAISATRTCGCYRAPDNVLYADLVEDTTSNTHDHDGSTSSDLCTCLWTVLSKLCCQTLCGCWLQCCGMCGTAQETREIESLVPKKRLLMDYVTFQEWEAYFPAIEKLRRDGNGSLIAHWKTLSQLSANLIRTICIILVILGVYAATNIDSAFTFANLFVVLATFLQSLILMYFVHWRWHRFDLSVDGVVKYFASGFLFSTSSAMIFEILVSYLLNVFAGVVAIISIVFEVSIGEIDTAMDQKDIIKILVKDNIWLGVLYMFMNAFVVAATTEELCKYFGWFIVETPDINLHENDADETKRTNSEEGGRRDLNSRGAAITIAMVSTAVGFSCCENLEYVFSSADIDTEIGTLLVRSLFPVHALAAAIQSIGICRRDLEGDKSYQLGRSILPAVILHGCFDFFLMVTPILSIAGHVNDMDDDNGHDTDDKANRQAEYNNEYNSYLGFCSEHEAVNEDVWKPIDSKDATSSNTGEESTELDTIIALLAYGLSILSVVIGTLYYIVHSRKQKQRLFALDAIRSHDTSLGLS